MINNHFFGFLSLNIVAILYNQLAKPLFNNCYSFFQDVDECANVICGNGGTCTDKINGFQCTCVPGFTGKLCETGK